MEISNSQEQTEQLALFPEASICSSEEHPASPSQSPESAKEWGGQADLQSTLCGFFERCVPGGLSGKTCRWRFRAGRTDSETSTFWSTNMQNAGMLVLGAYSTLNMCEWTDSLVPFLSEDGVCSLSDILEPSGNIPQRYFLSPTACLGILRRAESRGKALPPILQEELERQASSGCVPENLGGGKGALVSEEKSLTLSAENDQTVICHSASFMGGQGAKAGGIGFGEQTSPTIKASPSGGNQIPDVVLSLAASQAGELGCIGENISQTLSRYNGGFSYIAAVKNGEVAVAVNAEEGTHQRNFVASIGNGQTNEAESMQWEVCQTLNCMHETQKILRVGDKMMSQYGEVAGTLEARHDSSPCADRGQNIVFCYENHAQDSRIKDTGDVSPQLNAKSGTGGNNLPLVQTFTKTAHPQNAEQGHGFAETETAKTLSVHTSPASEIRAEELVCASGLSVRRLLPLETERLMGFPDNWTRIPWKGKPEDECPDGHRYKACGNSMCVNVMRWIGLRIELVERKVQK